jgi:hypothetical protein
MKSKVEIYALSVCFAAVVCLIISFGIAGYSIIEIVNPELTMSSYKYDQYQTNEDYRKNMDSCEKEEKTETKIDEELTKQRIAAFAVAVKSEKREGFQSLIQCLMFILVSSITLLIHWKIAQRARIA